MILKEIIDKWFNKNGQPSIIVTCRCNHFSLKEIMQDHLGSTIYIDLPDIVWPHNTIYFENVFKRERIEIE